jgi:hypothetical protein
LLAYNKIMVNDVNLALVLRYLLFVTRERQVANNPTIRIDRCRLGPAGPLA